jgi:hypothetical protein
MHDLDRTWFETDEQESEYEGEQALETLLGAEIGEVTGNELHESQELELASELLGLASEQELEQFLGNLLRSTAGATNRFIRSPTGRQLTGVLRQTAKKTLPIVGRAAGEWIRPGGGGPGTSVASGLGSLFGLELEGLSAEDRELEVARGFVRFAADAARRAVTAPVGASPDRVVRSSVAAAAQQHAPGLLTGTPPARRGQRRSGRWSRRGNSIIIHGV